MAEDKRKADAWQTITLLIVVLALFGGLYVSNQALDTRLDSVEQSISGNAEMLKMIIERVEDKIVAIDSEARRGAAKVAVKTDEPDEEDKADKEGEDKKGEKKEKKD